jgi:phage shock protein A
MSTFSRLRYVVAANINALLEKAEDPAKLLRALIREMEDAGEDARLACADLLAEQQRLERLDSQLTEETDQWQQRAEAAVRQHREELARAALKARGEIADRRKALKDEQQRLTGRLAQVEQDMATLKGKLAEAKRKLIALQPAPTAHGPDPAIRKRYAHPGERRIRSAMERFDRLQAQVESLEARVRSYEIGGQPTPVWSDAGAATTDPVIEEQLEELKQRLGQEDKVPDPQAEVSA